MNLDIVFKRIHELRSKLQELLPLRYDTREKLNKRFRLEWNYNSSHIEGNTLTYSETELLIIFDRTTGEHEMREYEEMKAHDVAVRLVYDYAAENERELNETFIKQLNEVLLVRPFWKLAITADGQQTRRLIDIGIYKKHPNSVRLPNGEIFHYASPEETPAMMNDLMQNYRGRIHNHEFHPVQTAALLHYEFVRIHPFDDGNGRIARLLMNYVLIKNGYPPVVIKSSEKKITWVR